MMLGTDPSLAIPSATELLGHQWFEAADGQDGGMPSMSVSAGHKVRLVHRMCTAYHHDHRFPDGGRFQPFVRVNRCFQP